MTILAVFISIVLCVAGGLIDNSINMGLSLSVVLPMIGMGVCILEAIKRKKQD